MKTDYQDFAIKTLAIFALSWFFFGQATAQIQREHPEHPKGNSATMYLALPHYNEACELYANGEIEKAKLALYEAINISFELTEAQLFLADIFYKQGKLDSAFLYYHAGIDFNIEQKPHYYFYLFELGMELGQYDRLKHNLKHFHKIYDKQGIDEPYEQDYRYRREDLEYYDACIDMVYNYKNWMPNAKLERSLNGEKTFAGNTSKGLIVKQKNNYYLVQQKGQKEKQKMIKGVPKDAQDLFISFDHSVALYTLQTKENQRFIFAAIIKNNQLLPGVQLSDKINAKAYQGSPFLSSDGKNLYFVADLGGNKDLFVADFEASSFAVNKVLPLDRINTTKDEDAPFYDSETQMFYYVSNGRVGFGGHDVFYCPHSETIEGLVFPFDPQNIGAPFNSNENDIQLQVFGETYWFNRQTKGKIISEEYQKVEGDDFIYELSPKVLPENN